MSKEFTSVGDVLARLYRPLIEDTFKDHPDRDQILKDIFAGNLNPSQIDAAFAEAAEYSYKRLSSVSVDKEIINGRTHDIYPDRDSA